jgi:acetyl-CoA C-acetyltransferase
MPQPVLVAGARTPIGKLLGSLAALPAPALGGIAVEAALRRAGITGDQVDAVILGHVVQAGAGPNPARLAAARGGIPMSVPAATVNKLCLSGLAAIAQAAQQVQVGYSRVVVAGGMESMSNAPHLSRDTRRGLRYGGGAPLEDALESDALVCGFDGLPMGAATDKYQARLGGISRAEQDEFAAESHARAVAAVKEGRLGEEIETVAAAGRKGGVTLEQDEGIRPGTTAERLARLPAAFSPDGTITAGSASQLSDGACAVVVMDKDEAQRRGLAWLAEIGGYGTVAGPDPSLLLQPANAVRDALRRDSQGRDGTLQVDDLDLIEINEAFAGVALASQRDLGVPRDRVNVNGGAIALGHPVGMSGARLVLTLALELRRRGGGTGAAALCGGGGQGDALILRVPANEFDVLTPR